MFTCGRTLKRRKRAREKIRTCTGAPDFEINRIKKKGKNEKEKRYKMKERIKKKQYAVETNGRKGESKNNRNDRGTNAKPRCSRGVLSNVELDLTWRAHVKTNRYTLTQPVRASYRDRACMRERKNEYGVPDEKFG